jgi:hypothetical protein
MSQINTNTIKGVGDNDDVVFKTNNTTRITIASGGNITLGGNVTLPTTTTTSLSAPSVSAVNTSKAWVNFNGTGTAAIGDSYNVASLTDNGAGDYTVNFATDIASAVYCAVGSSGAGATAAHNKNLNIHTQAAGSVKVTTSTTDNVLTDCGTVNVTIFASC